MNISDFLSWSSRAIKTIAVIVFFSYMVPLILGTVIGIPAGTIFALISSTFILQATAAVVAATRELNPAYVLVAMTSVALGAVLAIFEICDSFAAVSERVQQWIQKTEQRLQKIPRLMKYGAISLIFISWIPGLGLYSSAVIAWLFRWNRIQSIFYILLGWVLASLGIMLAAMGIVRIG